MAVLTGTGNVTTATATGVTVTPVVPANTVVGDLLVAGWADKNGSGTTTFPAGWTVNPNVYPGSVRHIGLAYYPVTDSAALTALGTPGTSTVSVSIGSGTSRREVVLARVTGRDLTAPFDAAGASVIQGSASSTLTIPEVTVTDAGSDLVAIALANVSGDVQYVGTGVNGLTEIARPKTYDGASSSTLMFLRQDNVAAGTTSTRTVTISPTPTIAVVGIMAAFAPAPFVAETKTLDVSQVGTGVQAASIGQNTDIFAKIRGLKLTGIGSTAARARLRALKLTGQTVEVMARLRGLMLIGNAPVDKARLRGLQLIGSTELSVSIDDVPGVVRSLSTVTLTTTVTGTIDSIQWTQLSGPIVTMTLINSGFGVTFKAPASITGDDVSIQAIVTSGDRSFGDTAVVAIAPHCEWKAVDGVWKPINMKIM